MSVHVLIKLAKTPLGIDFYKVHKEIIEQNGYVDFARISHRRICSRYICGNYIFIKESKAQGNRVFKAIVDDEIQNGEKFPQYYENLNISDCQWMRFTSLELVDLDFLLKDYCLTNGKSLEGTFKGSVPWVFIQKRE